MVNAKINSTVILPSYNPSDRLLETLRGLISEGFDDIILIDDGSREDCQKYFSEAEKLPQCTVLHHEVNKGKGRGLKTGFEYFLKKRPDRVGVVTTDDDGQHTPPDVLACTMQMEESQKAVFGCRDFSGDDVPWKSSFGNNCTRIVFRAFCGIKISDTQTGLRAFPREYIQLLCDTDGERFEYETNCLLEMHKNGYAFEERKIQTVYLDNNSETHFHPLKDSVKIYAVILKFMLSSGLSSIIDIAVFTLINMLMPESVSGVLRVFIATFGARVVSSLFNFFANRTRVFKSKDGLRATMARYYILCVIQTACSYGIVYLLSMLIAPELRILQSVIKIVVDVVLFFISFRIQQDWVFKSKTKEKK